MIEFKNVTKNFDGLLALNNVSFTIPSACIFGIVGKSGAGKSTLLRTINRLEEIDEGQILIDGVDITSLKGKELLKMRKNIGMIFQSFSLMQTKSVYNNIALPLQTYGYSKSEIKNKVEYLAEVVGIKEKLKEKPRNLSGGQCQRVAIARALALNPKILLCDEATSALDPQTTKSILKLLLEIKNKFDITIVMVTHQMEVVKEVCDRIAILNDGILQEEGYTDELFTNSSIAMKELTDEEEIVPVTGVNIKISFPKESSEEPIITMMARELDIDFSIVWGKLEKFKDSILGSLIINIDENNLEEVTKYLKAKNIIFNVVEKGE